MSAAAAEGAPRARPYDSLAVGDEAHLTRLAVADDFVVFAHASGNLNPIHLGGEEGARAPAMWVGALVSAVLGNVLPGPGTVYKAQALSFAAPVRAGEELKITVRVKEKRAAPEVVLETIVERVPDGMRVCEGEAVVDAPAEAAPLPAPGDVPGLLVQRHRHFEALLARAAGVPPLKTAVVAPEEPLSLGGALRAARMGLIEPVLVGDPTRIRDVAAAAGLDLAGAEIVAAPSHGEAAGRSVAMVHEGRVEALMKGHLHTDELLSHVVKRDGGLRTGKRLSYVSAMDVPGLPRPLLVSDSALNIAPDLETKVHMTQNAIDLARAIGIDVPRVAILAAVETVDDKMPATLDAAVLAKMAERGQIRGGIVDGPLAFDNAVSVSAARTKGIDSPVAGCADILLAPNIEAANIIVKQLVFVAHAEGGGIVVGARAPVILTSRADDEMVRLGSCAVAALYAAANRPAAPALAAAE